MDFFLSNKVSKKDDMELEEEGEWSENQNQFTKSKIQEFVKTKIMKRPTFRFIKTQCTSIRIMIIFLLFFSSAFTSIVMITTNIVFLLISEYEATSLKQRNYGKLETFVVDYFNNGETITSILADNVGNDPFGLEYNHDLTNLEYVQKSTIPILASAKKHTKRNGNHSIGYSDTRGNIWVAFEGSGRTLTNYYNPGFANINISEWKEDGTTPINIFKIIDQNTYPIELNKTEVKMEYVNYDVRKLKWYKNANLSNFGDVLWTESYTISNTISFVITTKVRNVFNDFIGVLSIFYELNEIQNFLRNSMPEKTTQITYYIINKKTNHIIGSNVDNMYIQYATENGTKLLYEAHDSPHDVISSTSAYIKAITHNYKNVVNGLHYSITVNSNKYFAYINNLNITNFDIMSVSCIPYSVGGTQFATMVIVSILIGCVVFLVLLIPLCAIGLSITRPLDVLRNDFEKIKQMKLEEIDIKYSKISEFQSIQRSFFLTVEKLKVFKSFLPRSLFEGDENSTSSQPPRDSMEISSSNVKFFGTSFSSNGKPDPKFLVGLLSGYSIISFIKIENFSLVVKVHEDEYMWFLSEVLDSAVRISEKMGGYVDDYGLNSIVLSFQSAKDAVGFALDIEEVVGKLKSEKKSLEKINFRLFIHQGKSVKGIIGGSTTKKRSFWGSGIEVCKFLGSKDIVSKLQKQDGVYEIFYTSSIVELLGKTCLSYPIDIIVCGSYAMGLYRFIERVVEDNKNNDHDKWCYKDEEKSEEVVEIESKKDKDKKKKVRKPNDELGLFINLMIGNEMNKAKDEIWRVFEMEKARNEKNDIKYEFLKKMCVLMTRMVEKGEKFEDLKGKKMGLNMFSITW